MADDSVTIQKVVNLTFADEGIEVYAVSDGIEAVDRLMEISPDLVMADVNMPGINGYRVCERIKQHEKFRNTPVILLVGSFEPFDEQEARRVGADDYLTKPFQSIRQLVNKVSDLLERSTATAENAETAAPTPLENSFAETQEMPPPEAEILEAEIVESEEDDAPRYEDAGFDDEMIQANPASGFVFDEAQKFASRNYVEPKEEVDNDDDYGKSQPLSDADLSETESGAPDDYAYSTQEDSAATPQQQEQTYQTENTPAPQAASSFASDEDDDLLELFGDEEFEEDEEELAAAEEDAAMAETENLQPQAEAGSESEIDAESRADVSETENYQAAETEYAEVSAATETVESSEEAFVVQPLEAEAVESADAQSVQPEEAENIYSAEPVEGSFQQYGEETQTVQASETENAQSNEAATAAAGAARQPQQPQPQLSPEMIDAIAQRVIEKLSENAVKEIAWEVVPQQADLIIKKMVEEKLKE
ncbi:MAG: response regulator [Acidobacteriota bacterium]|nr:response regulator [Acidobacteriota bacterium]